MDFDVYVRARILDPLGMSDTYTDIPAEHRGDRFATGYTRLGRDGQRAEATSFQARGIAPAAGFSSTVEDLARFASWQFRLLEIRGSSGCSRTGEARCSTSTLCAKCTASTG